MTTEDFKDMSNYTKWEEDLTKNIRFGDHRDDSDGNNGWFPEVPEWSIQVYHPTNGFGQTMTVCNIDNIKSTFLKVREKAKCILEIGVDFNATPTEMTSTRTLLDNKKDETVYVGIDIQDKSYLDKPEKNIYTMKIDSSNVEEIMKFIRSKGVKEIDYLFIDGWHSINQVIREWEFTRWLSKDGVVGFHDVSLHPGPNMFVKYLNREKWEVIIPCSDNKNDYGVAFTWRKQ